MKIFGPTEPKIEGIGPLSIWIICLWPNNLLYISFLSYGPVNIFWSTRYDKAMTLFITCLKEFAEFANFRDQENNIPPEKCFKLPYK